MQDTVSMRPSFCTWVDGSRMHFFAVFDGHGGPVVSVVLRDHMHAILVDEMSRAAAAYRKKQQQDEEAELCAWKGALRRSFTRADELAASGVPAGSIMGSTAVVALVVRGRILVANCGDSRAVLCRAGRAVPLSHDHKLARPDELAAPGVQGILTRSRALALHASCYVTSKQGSFLALSATAYCSMPLLALAVNSFLQNIFLQLSSYEKERKANYIYKIKCGSPTTRFVNDDSDKSGATTFPCLVSIEHGEARAANDGRQGHTFLNPQMTCEPDITITARSDDDDCLILASNGLWDVISNQKACNVTKKCLEDKSKGANASVGKEEEVRCVCAAIRLTNLAINEHSLDDISVVVLDLKVRC
ncbi:probable protein phosphatase 2C 37 [Triticum urartu]|uniref:probable protein phosphatase 2C 37 n=1 Tax=Triticum urartu TaxID=4572 RepID=UPI0020440F38|nr:probable protein phosphatase 2C 37 [Triticum urartu]XP_048539068.1 probable protein phosphatase 2C 37 [Triticum urartu]XP_048539069.1 probable protein phosphatase 2C 37 [Triticum urartu]